MENIMKQEDAKRGIISLFRKLPLSERAEKEAAFKLYTKLKGEQSPFLTFKVRGGGDPWQTVHGWLREEVRLAQAKINERS